MALIQCRVGLLYVFQRAYVGRQHAAVLVEQRRLVCDLEVACRRWQLAGDHFQQCALAAAIDARQGTTLALAQAEVDGYLCAMRQAQGLQQYHLPLDIGLKRWRVHGNFAGSFDRLRSVPHPVDQLLPGRPMASALLAKRRLAALLLVIEQDLGLVHALGLAPRPGLGFVQCLALL